MGISHNTGLDKYTADIATVGNREENVTLNFLPQTNLFFGAYYYYPMGRKGNRYYLCFGYSVPLTASKYDQLSGDEISSDSKSTLNIMSPGGIILGIGLSLGTGY